MTIYCQCYILFFTPNNSIACKSRMQFVSRATLMLYSAIKRKLTWLFDWLYWLFDWLTDLLTYILTDWPTLLTVWLTDWLTYLHSDWLTDLTDCLTDWLTAWLSELLTDWLIIYFLFSMFLFYYSYNNTPCNPFDIIYGYPYLAGFLPFG